MIAGVFLPSAFIIEALIGADHSRLSRVNANIFFHGQIVVYTIVGWFVSTAQMLNYHRQVLLEGESAKAIAERSRANRFVEAVSHDLRNVLNGMSNTLETVRLRARGYQALSPLIDEVQQQNRELGKLIDACFDLARLNSGTWKIDIRAVVLSNIIDRVVREGSALASRAGLEFDCEACPPFIVRTDADALTWILNNLVGNAIKYTPASKGEDRGRVSIEFAVAADEKSIVISIVDNGRGIPEDKYDEIFNEYVQLDNPARDRAKGFGLGLSIVRGLSRLLGDNPRVESTEGIGSRFSVTVPIASPVPQEWLAEDSQGNADDNLEDMVVLLIEDDPRGRRAMTRHLAERGATVIAGMSAEEVIAKVLEKLVSGPHFLLCDYRLPEGTGIDAIAAVRAAIGSQLPAAIITAETSADKLQMIAGYGLEVIPKTAEASRIAAILAKHKPSAGQTIQ